MFFKKAIYHNHSEVAIELIKSNEDLNIQDKWGNNALILGNIFKFNFSFKNF